MGSLAKVRQDAWSHEDDLLLAETVLRHIRDGSTQLNAFEEVGDKLNRTSAACGFRWNAEIRKKYIDAIELAKRQRKEKKRSLERQKTSSKRQSQSLVMTQNDGKETLDLMQSNHPTITLDHVIQFLHQLKQEYSASNQSKMTLDDMKKENDRLKQQNSDLEKKLSETRNQLHTIKEDYQVFVQIMDRARKMTVLDDQGSLKPPSFRMDKNGNLEQVIEGPNS